MTGTVSSATAASSNGRDDPVRGPLRLPRLPAVPGLGRLAGAPTGVLHRLREAAAAARPPARRVWRRVGRLHVAVRGVEPGRLDAFAADLAARVGALPGVAWAGLDPGCGRLVVAFVGSGDTPGPGPDVPAGGPDETAVLAAVEAAEAAAGASGSFPSLVEDHPADGDRLARLTVEAAADVAAIAAAGAGALLRLPRRWFPVDLAAITGMVQHQDRLRRPLEGRFGLAGTDLALAVANAAAQGLSQRVLAPTVDFAHRLLLMREAQSRTMTWARAEPALYAGPPAPGGAVVDQPARPSRVPAGPIERYADSALVASVAGALATVPFTDRVREATALLNAGVPKAARLGREAFAAGATEFLGRAGVVVLRPESLRLLDRLDCLVVDPEILTAADFELGAVVPLAELSAAECRRRAAGLLGAGGEPGWDLTPVDGPGPGREPSRSEGDDTMFFLRQGGRSVAFVELRRRPESPGARLVTAAEAAGVEVLLTRPGGYPSTHVLEGDGDVAGHVTHLQQEGRVVAVVAGPDEPALVAADCGVAVARPGRPLAWHADLVAADGLGGAAALLGASGPARDVSRHSVLLSLAGSTVSAITAIGPPLPGGRLPRPRVPVTLGVDLAALAALGYGHLRARRLTLPPAAPVEAPWHRLPPDDVLARLRSHPEGLSATEAAGRRPPPVAEPTLLGRFAGHFGEELLSPLTPVLAIGAGLSAAVGSAIDAAMIAGVVVADAGIGAAQALRAERAIAALDLASTQLVRVWRDGEETAVPAAELVVGDVITLGGGEGVPADCRLLEADGLEADESSLTGESLPVAKRPAPSGAAALAERHSMLYAGTAIAAGRCRAVLVATGEDTAAGQAAAGVTLPRTGVEARLEALAARATPVALAAGAATMAASLARGRPFPETLATGVSLAVAAVPEGLPILATAAQLSAGRRLAQKGALVRNVRAVEALGRVDVLCVDKTGTLTEGLLRVAAVHDGLHSSPPDQLDTHHRGILALAAATAAVTPPERRRPGSTDDAILTAAQQASVAPCAEHRVELPYESGRGYHAIACGCGRPCVATDAGGPVLAAVGAPETLLARCSHWRHPHSGRVPLDQGRRARLEGVVTRLAGRGGRVLAVAARPDPGDTLGGVLSDGDVDGLDLAGFLVLADPPRPDARAALERITAAGVRAVVVSGDHPATAAHLATQLGLLRPGGLVLIGPELDALDDDALDARLPALAVCARVTPAHKARLVTAYRRLGHCVAMTGDGVNDAAAIRLADVGVALGGRSTTAARHAADLVVTHDDIGTIVDALIEGRTLWTAVRDAVANLVGHNYGEIGVITGVGLLSGTTPLTARQLLLCNLFTDSVPALTIASRPAPDLDTHRLLAEGPDRSFGPTLTDAIATRGLAMGAAGTGAYLAARLTGTIQRARTVTLLSMVGTQLGQTAALRPRDPVVVGAAAASGAVLLGVVETPGISQLFGCRPVGPLGLGIAAAAAAAGTAATLLLPPAVHAIHQTAARQTETEFLSATAEADPTTTASQSRATARPAAAPACSPETAGSIRRTSPPGAGG